MDQNQIQKIILNDKLPNPTKWEIKENEPLNNLIKSDSLNLDNEMRGLFYIGEILNEKEIKSSPLLNKKDKILQKLNRIKKIVKIDDIKLAEKFEEIMNKYIKMISEESNEENFDKLYDDYELEAREILIENFYKKNINSESKEDPKFKVYYSSFPSDKNMKYFYDHPL